MDVDAVALNEAVREKVIKKNNGLAKEQAYSKQFNHKY